MLWSKLIKDELREKPSESYYRVEANQSSRECRNKCSNLFEWTMVIWVLWAKILWKLEGLSDLLGIHVIIKGVMVDWWDYNNFDIFCAQKTIRTKQQALVVVNCVGTAVKHSNNMFFLMVKIGNCSSKKHTLFLFSVPAPVSSWSSDFKVKLIEVFLIYGLEYLW